MIAAIRLATSVCIGLLVSAGPARAQAPDEQLAGRFEISTGGGWLGGAGMGSAEASLRAAETAARSTPLFVTDSRFAAAPLFHVKAGYALSRRVIVEGGLTLARPELRSSVRDDAEGAPPVTIAERIDQYGIDAGVLVMIRELGVGTRTIPFVAAGAGYLRQLHEGQTVVEEGHVYHAGGGVRHWLIARRAGLIRGAGLRADARLYLMSDGISFDDRPRPHVAISGSFFVTF